MGPLAEVWPPVLQAGCNGVTSYKVYEDSELGPIVRDHRIYCGVTGVVPCGADSSAKSYVATRSGRQTPTGLGDVDVSITSQFSKGFHMVLAKALNYVPLF